MMHLLPVILSGGSGTRLWPLSREAYPKQFLPLAGDESLLQATARRLDGVQEEFPGEVALLPPLIVCNEAHRFLVAEQFRLLERMPASIMLEPFGRNTAPALTLAALMALQDGDDPVLIVTPADHLIRDEDEFRRMVAQGLQLAEKGAVVTFGIVPDAPETGYGYIRKGGLLEGSSEACHLKAFVEKPDLATARGYLESGEYPWNSGIFVLKASLWLELLKRFREDVATACQDAFDKGVPNGGFFQVDAESFAACPSDSIDYSVMEKLSAGGGWRRADPGAAARRSLV